ncbi:MAG: O-antigen ligase family protein [candidate division KSB1 bacterium]|nr:O-antigen ligase family protein [candidate division KSB1 bacterium]
MSAWLFALLGFFLSINQGVTAVLGVLSDGTARGADVLMPMDIPLYLLLLIKKDQTINMKIRWISLTVKISLVLYILLALTGELIAVEPAQFRFRLVHFIRSLLAGYVIMTRLSLSKEAYFLSNGLLAGLAFQSFIGFWQWQVGPIQLPFFEITKDWRVNGTIGVANAFGAYLITLLPLCLRFALFLKRAVKYLWTIVAVLALGSLFATYTRAAWLAFVLTMTFMALYELKQKKLTRRQKSFFIVSGIFFLIIMAWKYGDVISARMDDYQESLVGEKKHSRLGLARDALRIIRENPLIGVGLDNYRYNADEEIQGLRIVHNAYLLIAAEQGIPAALIFIIINIIALVQAFKLLRSNDWYVYNIGFAVLCGLLGILIYHFAAPDYRLLEVMLQHWRLIGMAIGLQVVEQKILRNKKYPQAAVGNRSSAFLPHSRFL